MSYDYYCTHCGKKLNQTGVGAAAVLFDLSPIISDRVFNRIKWRVTESGLRNMVSTATADDGYANVGLSFGEFMKVVGNSHNLNNDIIEKVSIEEIRDYLDAEVISNHNSKQDNSLFDDLFDSGVDMLSGDESPDVPPEKEKAELSDALKKLLSLDTTQTGEHVTGGIKEDLKILNTVFSGQNETIQFDIKPVYELDNQGQNVLVGYEFRRNGKVSQRQDVRVCPECGKKVFAHAGTAEHRTVAFVADSRSGKTSTILALSDYTFNAITGNIGGSGIWAGSSSVPEVLELPNSLDLDPDPEKDLKHELELFRKGIAPVKTQDKTYNSTFRIKTKRNNSDVYSIITLVDIPGELCPKEGETDRENGSIYGATTIKRDKLLNQYQIALSCDAYVICFDKTKINPENGRAMADIQDVCIWADEFQKLRCQQRNEEKRYVPMMVLFTKCAEIEGAANETKSSYRAKPLEKIYMFRDELCEMGLQETHSNVDNPSIRVYRAAKDKFMNYGALRTAFFSVLRCSPFGYEAPAESDIEAGKELPYNSPQPKNIDLLMQWILGVSGCIPVKGTYDPEDGVSEKFELKNYYIQRNQCCADDPEDELEALARCSLFVNCGRIDKQLVETHPKGYWAERLMNRVMRKILPKKYSNLAEEV